MFEVLTNELSHLILSLLYFAVGAVLFWLTIVVADKLLPFSIRKEIEEDQNIALGIIMGSGLIAMAIILAAVLD